LAGFALDFQILPAYFGEKDFVIRFANLGFFPSIPEGQVKYRRSGWDLNRLLQYLQ